jgi:hypothetical protein
MASVRSALLSALRLSGAVRRRFNGTPVMRALRRSPASNARPPEALQGALEALKAEGVFKIDGPSFRNLLSPEGRGALDELSAQVAQFRKQPPEKLLMEAADLVETTPGLYTLGMSDALLNLAESYLGSQCLYLGAMLKREAANGFQGGTRAWHVDNEDVRMVRFLIYLNDVTPQTGPFEFVRAGPSRRISGSLHYRNGFIADDRLLASLEPGETNEEALGKAGDAFVFDGTRILHRAQPPKSEDRYSLTLSYCTRRPLEVRRTARLPKAALASLRNELNPRQAACLPPAIDPLTSLLTAKHEDA